MSRSRFAVLGLCVAFAACGEKFVANTGPGAAAGSSSAGRVDAQAGGETEASGSAGHDDAEAGDAGSDSSDPGGRAGAHANGGTGGLLGSGTGGSGGTIGSGTGGTGGTGGSSIEPMLPRTGLLVWLRADRGIQQTDGHVQSWLDQSGNQLNATASGTARPTYLADGFSGRATLEFDGAQEQFLRFTDGFGDFSNGVTGFIVAKPTTADCESMLEFSNGSEIDDIAMGMFEDKWAYEVATSYFQADAIPHDRFSLYTAVHRSTAASELRIDGSVKATLQMPLPVLPSSGLRLYNFVGQTLYEGGCKFFTGQISEIILYSRTLTLAEVNGIEKYLDTHWALSDQQSPTP